MHIVKRLLRLTCRICTLIGIINVLQDMMRNNYMRQFTLFHDKSCLGCKSSKQVLLKFSAIFIIPLDLKKMLVSEIVHDVSSQDGDNCAANMCNLKESWTAHTYRVLH